MCTRRDRKQRRLESARIYNTYWQVKRTVTESAEPTLSLRSPRLLFCASGSRARRKNATRDLARLARFLRGKALRGEFQLDSLPSRTPATSGVLHDVATQTAAGFGSREAESRERVISRGEFQFLRNSNELICTYAHTLWKKMGHLINVVRVQREFFNKSEYKFEFNKIVIKKKRYIDLM